VAEAFGKSNSSRVLDLEMNEDSIYSPGYAIYDGDILARLALFNFITDQTGTSDYTTTFSIGGGSMPKQVKVKSEIIPNFTGCN
jgi:hypothetical protein